MVDGIVGVLQGISNWAMILQNCCTGFECIFGAWWRLLHVHGLCSVAFHGIAEIWAGYSWCCSLRLCKRWRDSLSKAPQIVASIAKFFASRFSQSVRCILLKLWRTKNYPNLSIQLAAKQWFSHRTWFFDSVITCEGLSEVQLLLNLRDILASNFCMPGMLQGDCASLGGTFSSLWRLAEREKLVALCCWDDWISDISCIFITNALIWWCCLYSWEVLSPYCGKCYWNCSRYLKLSRGMAIEEEWR